MPAGVAYQRDPWGARGRFPPPRRAPPRGSRGAAAESRHEGRGGRGGRRGTANGGLGAGPWAVHEAQHVRGCGGERRWGLSVLGTLPRVVVPGLTAQPSPLLAPTQGPRGWLRAGLGTATCPPVGTAGTGLAAAEDGVRFYPLIPGFWCGRGGQINTSVEGAFLRPRVERECPGPEPGREYALPSSRLTSL